MNDEKFLKAILSAIAFFCFSFYVHPGHSCRLLRELFPGNLEQQKRTGRTLFVLFFGAGIAMIPSVFYRRFFWDWLADLSIVLYIITLILVVWCSRKR